jgi:ABC-2 type transport system permease protein
VLPVWLQRVANLVPLTHALDGMRFALLQGHSVDQLLAVIVKLAAFAVVLLAGGIFTFNRAVELAKRTGSLTEY